MQRAKAGIPCWNRTSLCGFAGRRLNCSANGIEIESAGGSFHSRLRCYLVLVSLNRSLFANKVRDYCRDGRVETDYVKHAAEFEVEVDDNVMPGKVASRDWVLCFVDYEWFCADDRS